MTRPRLLTSFLLFFTDKSAFWTSYFFREIMLESWGCGLYTIAAYTRVFTVVYMKDEMALNVIVPEMCSDGCLATGEQTLKIRSFVPSPITN